MQELFNFTPFASCGDGFNLSATVKDGQPWFIAADVCRSLEIKNSRQALARLPATEKGVISTYTPGGVQEVGAVNESGLYRLIFTSRKAAAERFKDWVFNAVLPSLRKHGGYINGQEGLRPEAQAEVVKVVHEAARRVRSALGEEHRDRHRLLRTALR